MPATKRLQRWIDDAMTAQFIDGVIVGFLCGSTITASAAVWWAQDRAIVRAAGPVRQAQMATAPPPPQYPSVASVPMMRLDRTICRLADTLDSTSPLFDDCVHRAVRVSAAHLHTP